MCAFLRACVCLCALVYKCQSFVMEFLCDFSCSLPHDSLLLACECVCAHACSPVHVCMQKMKVFWVGMYRGYGQLSKVFHDMVQTEPALADQLQVVAGHLDR